MKNAYEGLKWNLNDVFNGGKDRQCCLGVESAAILLAGMVHATVEPVDGDCRCMSSL